MIFSKRKLVPWLRLILRNQTILETMYDPTSYVVTTGHFCNKITVKKFDFCFFQLSIYDV